MFEMKCETPAHEISGLDRFDGRFEKNIPLNGLRLLFLFFCAFGDICSLRITGGGTQAKEHAPQCDFFHSRLVFNIN